ncbi:MAG: hypothetical protein GY802_15790 [Gammaproteobacteria bacterium]|nr:hypothetical protein [Gammaproteobacteria bacterium]
MTILDRKQTVTALQALHHDWLFVDEEKSIKRMLPFKGYSKAVYAANLCAAICDRESHHAEITFGWGYCQLQLTTHDADGLTEKDFQLASKLDQALTLLLE